MARGVGRCGLAWRRAWCGLVVGLASMYTSRHWLTMSQQSKYSRQQKGDAARTEKEEEENFSKNVRSERIRKTVPSAKT